MSYRYSQNIVGARSAYPNLLNTYQLGVMVYGDTALNVGDVIDVDLVETGTAGDRDLSIYSGSWFVKELTHTCDTQKFNTSMILCKAALEHKQTKQ